MPTPDASGTRPPTAAHRPPHLTAAVQTVLARRRHVTVHLLVYAVVNAVLVVVWLVAGLASGTWFPWPLLSLAAWGLALQLHWWWAYGPLSRLVREEILMRGAQPPGPP
ncbi:2TM domain-containing protein [Blastococcus tunisiensis]|uniref:2TM domain-containing protein n=1 Tax=Blastococcus tunisiensis TaxID=1798228 RepID=A0A1I2E1W2_9ACTN|nr:2TM domain-containing protein [Blastococcus sp. DSM 46838]SFE86190.1 2TM domain-containing protein [Blastococcus sp. DSM 46838]